MINLVSKLIVFVALLYGVSISNINSLNKRIIYIIFVICMIYGLFEPFSNYNNDDNYTDKRITNSYPIKSYKNVEELTYDHYIKNYKYIVKNINKNTADIDLSEYAWPTNFNKQSQDFLDKTRFVKTSIPFPTNADFF